MLKTGRPLLQQGGNLPEMLVVAAVHLGLSFGVRARPRLGDYRELGLLGNRGARRSACARGSGAAGARRLEKTRQIVGLDRVDTLGGAVTLSEQIAYSTGGGAVASEQRLRLLVLISYFLNHLRI